VGLSEEDRKEIEAVLSGDTQVYANLVRKYQRSIYYTALRMLRNPEDADEVTQKTFVKAYKALSGFRFESSLKTWLTTIAINLCRTELMKTRREMVELPANLADSGFENRKEQELVEYKRGQLREALESLPQRQREVVTLRIYQEMPFKEVAKTLGSNETAVKVNFHHAMKSLKEWMAKKVKNEEL